MRMRNYLDNIKFAVTNVLEVIWHEHEELEKLNSEMSRLFTINWNKYPGVRPIHTDREGSINIRITGQAPSTFFSEEERLLYEKNKDKKLLEQNIWIHKISISALSGTLLQFAKQGISMQYGGLKNCPAGREIGSQDLKTIILQGRNQAMHWEEGLRPATKNCFSQLVKDFGLQFGGANKKSLAFEVINVLEWKTFGNFERDLQLIASLREPI